MELLSVNRRGLLKAGLSLAATAALPPLARAAISADTNDILARAKAAIDRHRLSLLYTDIVGMADFGPHSSRPRFHLVDMMSGSIESFLVTHGEGSDPQATGWLTQFSNEPGSRATSQGSYLTRNGYEGQFGAARRITGLDPENDRAYDRAIVIHGTEDVSADILARYGMIGFSWGCFAFSYADIGTILDRLGPGRLLHAYSSRGASPVS